MGEKIKLSLSSSIDRQFTPIHCHIKTGTTIRCSGLTKKKQNAFPGVGTHDLVLAISVHQMGFRGTKGGTALRLEYLRQWMDNFAFKGKEYM